MSDPISTAPAAAADAAPASTAPETSQEAALKEALPKETAPENKDSSKKSRERKIKVDGKEETINLDEFLGDEEKLLKELQMSRAAQKRMSETAELKKQQAQIEAEIQEFFKMLKEDPKRILKDPNLGLDARKLAEEIMAEELEKAAKDPKELALEEAQKELEKLRKEQAEEKARLEKERYEAMVNEHATRMEHDILGALSAAQLPNNPMLIHRIAQYMEAALTYDIDLAVKDVIPIVQREFQSDVKETVKAMKPDQVKALFGDVVDGLRKEDIKKIKEITNLNAVKDVGAQPPAPAEDKRISIKQWLKTSTVNK